MKLFFSYYLLALVLHVTRLAGVGADTPIPSALFINSPLTVVEAVAPLWHMDKKTCFPTAATQPDGSQTHGSRHDNCVTRGRLDAGCPIQAPHTHQAQLSTPFPTYYTLSYCYNDDSWRVGYDVFFQKVGLLVLRFVTSNRYIQTNSQVRTQATGTTGNGL